MIEIHECVEGDLTTVRELAERSWWNGYKDVLSPEQITFMLENIYSINALEEAMMSGQIFYILSQNTIPVGFMSVKTSIDMLRIEKLYLVPQVQGQGLGKVLIDHAASICRRCGLHTMELNVNRRNTAYFFYLKQGFSVLKEVDTPYYEFVLDDYVMRKHVI